MRISIVLIILIFCSCNNKSNDTYYKLAEKAIQEDKSDSATYYLNQIIKSNHPTPQSHLLLGDILFQKKKIKKAVHHFNKAHQLDSLNTEALLKLGEINLILGKNNEAFKFINSALKINNQLYEAYLMKGVIYKHLKDTTKAISSLKTAIEVNPKALLAYEELGLLLTQIKDTTAIFYYKNGIEQFNNDMNLKIGLCWSLQQFGKIKAAKSGYIALHKKHGKSPMTLFNLSWLYLNENNIDSADFYIQQAFLADSTDTDVRNLKSTIESQLGSK